MRKLLAIAATITAVTVPSGTEPAATESTPIIQESPRLRSTSAQRDAVSITVYNQNFGLVREIRTLDLSSGRIALEYGDVASGIQPVTVHIRPLSGGPLQVLEQNYQFDLLSPQKLLEKYVGRTINVYRTNPQTGVDEAVEAEVVSVNGGTILRIGGEISYLTNSLNWKSDYVMVLNEDDDGAALTGWVTLTNQSGTAYENARLQLVAGDVQRVQGNMRPESRSRMMADAMAMQERDGFTENAFFEYHLYTLGRPADLMNNGQKQVTLLESENFGVERKLIFHGATHYYRGQYGQVTSNQKVGVFLDSENSERNGLGMPLPKGVVRVYKRDHTDALQFIGEDLIDHTPRDEELRIKMGEAFDVVGDRRQMDYSVISGCVSESTWQIDLRNHKDEDVEVMLVEPVGGDWQILSSTHPFEQTDAWTFTLTPEVEANGETRVEYRVRVRWC